MKKIWKVILVLAIMSSVAGHIAGIGFLYSMKDELLHLGKRSVQYVISLHSRMKALEEAQNALPAGGEVETTIATSAVTETSTPQDTSSDTIPADTQGLPPQDTTTQTTMLPATTEAGTDTIEPQETEASPTAETTMAPQEPAQNYRIGVFHGIIGVYDNEGNLRDTCNVYVMTLPEADRKSLMEGIWAETLDDVQNILENFV